MADERVAFSDSFAVLEQARHSNSVKSNQHQILQPWNCGFDSLDGFGFRSLFASKTSFVKK